MGLGDEILALGRAEALFEKSGKPVSIVNDIGAPRDHPAWHGNPAWIKQSSNRITDGAGCRPYIKHWNNRQAVYNMDYRARAGKIHLTEKELSFAAPEGAYIVISPFIKGGSSVNKNWGEERWECVVRAMPLPVYQLIERQTDRVISGAKPIHTPDFRLAARVIKDAKLVLTNEGGSHHMAASFGVPAVVIFGSFVPPQVTGYDFHANIYRETAHGFCGKWDLCLECQKALADIKPDEVITAALEFLK